MFFTIIFVGSSFRSLDTEAASHPHLTAYCLVKAPPNLAANIFCAVYHGKPTLCRL
jgi:hypothetical protein